jgi:hypothetical protein
MGTDMRRVSARQEKRMVECLNAFREGLARYRDALRGLSQTKQKRLRRANVVGLQLSCDHIGARAKWRGLTERKLKKLLSEKD